MIAEALFLCVLVLMPVLYVIVWIRARLRFTVTDEAVRLETRTLGVIPWRLTLPAGSVEEVRCFATWRDVRDVAARGGFFVWPLVYGTPFQDKVVIRRTRGFYRIIIAYTDRASELAAALERMRVREPGSIAPGGNADTAS